MKVLILIMAMVASGCSYGTVTTRSDNARDCTTHYGAPAADTLFAGTAATAVVAMPVVYVASTLSGSSDPQPFVAMAVIGTATALYTGFSAAYGYREVSKCRKYIK